MRKGLGFRVWGLGFRRDLGLGFKGFELPRLFRDLRTPEDLAASGFADFGLPCEVSKSFRVAYMLYPTGPCTQIVYTVAPKYLYRDCFKSKVYTIWVHGPLNPKP